MRQGPRAQVREVQVGVEGQVPTWWRLRPAAPAGIDSVLASHAPTGPAVAPATSVAPGWGQGAVKRGWAGRDPHSIPCPAPPIAAKHRSEGGWAGRRTPQPKGYRLGTPPHQGPLQGARGRKGMGVEGGPPAWGKGREVITPPICPHEPLPLAALCPAAPWHLLSSCSPSSLMSQVLAGTFCRLLRASVVLPSSFSSSSSVPGQPWGARLPPVTSRKGLGIPSASGFGQLRSPPCAWRCSERSFS